MWPIKSRQTNKHTLLFYRYRRADQGRLRPKIKYDSVRFEKLTLQEKANCKLNLGSGMLVFFFPFFENVGSYVYDSMRARAYGFVFERHQRSDFFVEKLYGMRTLALAVHACPRARGRPRRRPLLSCSRSTRRQRRKVDKCRVADKKQTDTPTNKHTLLFYRYRLADHAEPCSATVPSQHWAAEKQT